MTGKERIFHLVNDIDKLDHQHPTKFKSLIAQEELAGVCAFNIQRLWK